MNSNVESHQLKNWKRGTQFTPSGPQPHSPDTINLIWWRRWSRPAEVNGENVWKNAYKKKRIQYTSSGPQHSLMWRKEGGVDLQKYTAQHRGKYEKKKRTVYIFRSSTTFFTPNKEYHEWGGADLQNKGWKGTERENRKNWKREGSYVEQLRTMI